MDARRYLIAGFFAPPVAAGIELEFEITPEMIGPLSTEMQREIAGLQYLLNRHQLRQFFGLETHELRRQWTERWWRSQDPTPTTAENQMRTEHYKRVRTARLQFGWHEWPGWDERGEVFIRYGPPEFSRDLDWIVTPKGVTPPGESWHYTRHDMTVVFEDYNLKGRYIFKSFRGGNPDTRRVWGGGGAYGPQGDTSEPIDADFDGPRGYPIVPPTNWWYVYMSEKSRESVNNFLAVLETYPATYPFNFDRNEIPFVFGVSRFKGGGSVNRVDVNFEIRSAPIPELFAGETQQFDVTTVFFDADYGVIDREYTEISIPAKALPQTGEKWSPAQLVFTVPEGYYRTAVTVEETGSGRQSSYRSTVSTRDYEHDMAISDVVLCSKIDTLGRESPFGRGALEVVPRPRVSYAVAQTVPVYFEVYNLEVDDDGTSSYDVEYWIIPRAPRKPGTYAASQFESSAHGPDVPLYVTIDTDYLWEGEFEFHVKVTDKRTLFVAERAAVFRLTD